jgi:putative alpha-1,2-mannosidase
LKVGILQKQKQAESLWDKQLAKIDITESKTKKLFYTALPYHGAAILHKILMVDTEEETTKFTRVKALIIIRYSHYGILFVRHIHCIP